MAEQYFSLGGVNKRPVRHLIGFPSGLTRSGGGATGRYHDDLTNTDNVITTTTHPHGYRIYLRCEVISKTDSFSLYSIKPNINWSFRKATERRRRRVNNTRWKTTPPKRCRISH